MDSGFLLQGCPNKIDSDSESECIQAHPDLFLFPRQGGEGNYRLGEEGELEVLSADPTASGEYIFNEFSF